MSANRRSGERIGRNGVAGGKLPTLCALLALGLAGCAHRPLKVHLPSPYPVDLESLPQPEDSQIQPLPEPEVAPLQWPEPPKPPVRRRPAAPTEAGVPNQPGNEAPPEVAIGPLTTGGESNPQSQQQARDLIGSVDRRIGSLPARTAGRWREQIRQARNLLEQAKQALNTGDAEGARTVADKARQIMDEVERQ